MDNGVRKKRTLAERRESDKLRQRRFRAKKREEARLLQVITGTVEKEKKERVYSFPKKTADEIRETNRIRQQRFRARRRVEVDQPAIEEIPEITPPIPVIEPVVQIPLLPENTVEFVQRLLQQAANDEKNRQTEIRREKDRIRKRRERQRKKDRALKLAGLTPEQMMKDKFEKKLEYLQKDMDLIQKITNSNVKEEMEDEEEEDDEEMDNESLLRNNEMNEDASDEEEESFDASEFLAQLEEMGLVLDVASNSDGSSDGILEIKQKTPEDTSGESTSSSPTTSTIQEAFGSPEKKPWKRCNSAEERRERERMRKRMYRAKQKYISTGKLEMQWDPAPIKRTPNDDSEEGITPLPEWNYSGSSPEQKLVAHRIYNKRYRERLKSSAIKEESSSRETSEPSSIQIDNVDVSSEYFKEMLSTISSQCDLTNLIIQNQVVE